MNISEIYGIFSGLFEWVWLTSLHASILVAVVILIQACFGRWVGPRLRYALGLLIVIRLLMPGVPQSSFSILNLRPSFAPANPAQAVERESATIAIDVLPPDSVGMGGAFALTEPTFSQRDWQQILLLGAQMVWLAGLVIGGFLMIRAQFRLRAWAQTFQPVKDPAVLQLLRQCQVLMRIQGNIRLGISEQIRIPALTGFWKPWLLLPKNGPPLSKEELRHIFLHELAHVRRGDVLLNWVIALARTLHWFNPLVWWTARNLRAAREQVCDLLVLKELHESDQQAYGQTLIKLAASVSRVQVAPGLVPAISNEHEMKRRIRMIAQFKKPRRVAVILAGVVVILVFGVTFTGAKEKASVEPASGPELESFQPRNAPTRTAPADSERRQRAVAALERELWRKQEEIEGLSAKLNELRKHHKITDSSDVDHALWVSERRSALNQQLAKVEAEHAEVSFLHEHLERRSQSELPKLISRVLSDEIVTALLRDKTAAEQRVQGLLQQVSPEHPDVQQAAAVQRQIQQQLAEYSKGALLGLKVRGEVLDKRIDTIRKAIAEAKDEEIEFTKTFKPYLDLRRQLEDLHQVRRALSLRIQQERVDILMSEEGLKF